MFKFPYLTLSIMSTVILSACGAEAFTEEIKIRQSYNIYIAGNYSILEGCPNPDTLVETINLGEKSVRIDHTVCDVTAVKPSSDPAGLQILLQNCRADGDVPPSAEITIENQENHSTYLHGWFAAPKRIYHCSTEK